MKKKAIIFGIKKGKEYYYIGKTNTDKATVYENGMLNRSCCSRQYFKGNLREFFQKNENNHNNHNNNNHNNNDHNKTSINIELLKYVPNEQWYNKKLKEVIEKHKQNHPLLNAQWMLEGKRGYWQDKKRDSFTLQRLSKSKYKRIVQYDPDGNLIKVWDSGKEIAIKVFKDYHVGKGGSKTSLYSLLRNQTIQGRFRYLSYWFKEKELLEIFDSLPNKLYIDLIKKKEKKTKLMKKKCNPSIQTKKWRYTIIHYNPDKTIKKIYNNVIEAAYELKLSVGTVAKICRGAIKKKHKDYILEYGKKTLQPIHIDVPSYSVQNIVYEKSIAIPIKTRTAYPVYEYDKNGDILKRFVDIKDASSFYKLSRSTIRKICKKNQEDKNNPNKDLNKNNPNNIIIHKKFQQINDKKNYPYLKFGEKCTRHYLI